MFHQMAQFRENQFSAGQTARIDTARHAKYHGPADPAGGGPGHDGGRVDLVETELGEQHAEGG